eukprot:jgi/Tetstr1/464080/TSEL_008885.t1
MSTVIFRIAKEALRRAVPVLVELGKQAVYKLPYPPVSAMIASQLTDLGSRETVGRLCDAIDDLAAVPAPAAAPAGGDGPDAAGSDAGDAPNASGRVVFRAKVPPGYAGQDSDSAVSIPVVFWALVERCLDDLPRVCTYDGAKFGPEAGVEFSVDIDAAVTMRGVWHRQRREHGDVWFTYDFEVASPEMTSVELVEWTKAVARSYIASRGQQPPGPMVFGIRFESAGSHHRPLVTEMRWTPDERQDKVCLRGWDAVQERVRDAADRRCKLGVSLLGSPGTGKTSACKDIMNTLAKRGYHFLTVDLNRCSPEYLSRLMFKPINSEHTAYNIPNHRKAFILDEADQYAALLRRSKPEPKPKAADPDEEEEEEERAPRSGAVTCQDVLTLLDGLFAHQGVWILMSNHPEKFDPAVMRAGRLGDVVVDTAAQFGAPERRQMMERLLRRPLDPDDEAFVASRPSGADVVKYVGDEAMRSAEHRDAKRARVA